MGLLSAVSVTCSQLQSENIKFPQPLTLSAGAIQTPILSWFDDPGSPKADDPFLMYGQKVNSSLTLSHNTYIIHLTSSHSISISSSPIITRIRVITGQWDVLRKKKRPYSTFITTYCYNCPDLCGSVDWVLACKPKGRWFDSQSEHLPGMWARSPVEGMWEATTHWYFSPSFLLPFPSL